MSFQAKYTPSFFSPSSITGCALWLDAADTSSASMTLSGSNVTTWKDKSGNSNATTTSVGPVPLVTNAINGLSVMQTSPGHFFYMEPLTNPANTTTVTAFAVSSAFNSAEIYGRMLSFGKVSDGTNNNDFSTVPNFIFCRNLTSEGVAIFRNNGTIATSITYTVPFLMEAVFDGTTCTGFLNGSQFNTFSSSGTFSFDRFGIGVNIDTKTDPSDVYSGNIGEILLFYAALTTSQRQQVEGYLAWKWGLQANLPTAHPYYATPIYAKPPFPLVPIVRTATSLTLLTSPTQISGCKLWLDGADPNGNGVIPSNGASISTWRDKSGNGNNATAGTSPLYNSTGANNLGVISFNGSSQFLNTQDLYSNRSFVIFAIVRRQASISTNNAFLGGSGNSANTNLHLMWRSSNTTLAMGFFANDLDYTSFPNYTGNPATEPAYLLVFYYTPGTRQIYVNGSLAAADTNSTNLSSYPGPTFGKYPSGGTFWTGFIGEFITYNAVLTTIQRQQVEGYLAWKWGLQSQLPASHPYARGNYLSLPSFSPSFNRATNQTFNPTQITGCVLWLDGADSTTLFQDSAGTIAVTANGQTVSNWKDKSIQANNATGTTNQPVAIFSSLNRLTGVNFSSSTSYLSLNISKLPTGSTNSTIFFVMRTIISGLSVAISWGGLSSNQGRQVYYDTVNISVDIYGGNVISDSTNLTNTFALISAIHSPTEAGWLNGTPFSGGTKSITLNTSATNAILGNQTAGGNIGLRGTICEAVCYNSSLSRSQRQQVEGYLAWKWGLQANLPSTHPYKLFPPSS